MVKLLRKSTPENCANWGYFSLTIFPLWNASAIHGSKSDVWDNSHAMNSTKTGHCLNEKNFALEVSPFRKNNFYYCFFGPTKGG